MQCIKEGTKSFVIDAEAVAWDTEEKRLLEFQKLSTRKRKDVKVEDVKVKVHLFAFDLLYLNGEVSARILSAGCLRTPRNFSLINGISRSLLSSLSLGRT